MAGDEDPVAPKLGDGLDALQWEDGRRVLSSNLARITTLGSSVSILFSRSSPLLPLTMELVTEPPRSRTLEPSIESSAYSGRPEKLSGLTMTWYVPGLYASAFRSRSSSEVNDAKGGSESPTADKEQLFPV